MDYKVNILVHILHRLNLGWIVTYMGRGRSKCEFHGHLARFSLHLWHLWHQWWRFYDSYDTSHIWRLISDIYDISGQNIPSNIDLMWVWEAQWAPTQIWGRWKARKEGTHVNSWAHTLIRLGLSLWMDWEPYKSKEFYKIQEATKRMSFRSFVKFLVVNRES